MSSSDTVGFIGLGQMGAGMARNVIQRHKQLVVYDPSEEARKPLEEAGATTASSPAELAEQADTIILCLPFSPQVESVIFGEDGLVTANASGITVLDATTLDRVDAIDFARRCAEHGITYCDCPVSGLPKRAASGTLTVMFGGEWAIYDQCKALLDATAESVIYCGPVGCGQAMKAINNIIYNINIVALCEVLPMAVAAGLQPNDLAELVTSGSSRSFASEHFIPKMMEGKFADDFPMGDAYKDIANVQRMGVETKALMPVTNAMISSYQQTLADGCGHEPKHAILKTYEKVLGVTLRTSS